MVLSFYHEFNSYLYYSDYHELCIPVQNEQICKRSALMKTDELQTTLSSAESVFSLLQTLSLNTLRDVN